MLFTYVWISYSIGVGEKLAYEKPFQYLFNLEGEPNHGKRKLAQQSLFIRSER